MWRKPALPITDNRQPATPGIPVSILRQRCPRCLEGKIYVGFLRMNDDCPLCNLHFEREEGYWAGREIVSTVDRFRPGASDVMALRVGYEKLTRETGWEPTVSWEDGISRTIAWYAANRERWMGRVDWLTTERARA